MALFLRTYKVRKYFRAVGIWTADVMTQHASSVGS